MKEKLWVLNFPRRQLKIPLRNLSSLQTNPLSSVSCTYSFLKKCSNAINKLKNKLITIQKTYEKVFPHFQLLKGKAAATQKLSKYKCLLGVKVYIYNLIISAINFRNRDTKKMQRRIS